MAKDDRSDGGKPCGERGCGTIDMPCMLFLLNA